MEKLRGWLLKMQLSKSTTFNKASKKDAKKQRFLTKR